MIKDISFLNNFRYIVNIELNNNQIIDLNTPILSKLTYLTNLSIKNNQIAKVEDLISLSLCQLRISRNRITTFNILHAPLLE